MYISITHCFEEKIPSPTFNKVIYHGFFLSGTRCSDANFQAYLLDGIARWNQDRADAALGSDNVVGHTPDDVSDDPTEEAGSKTTSQSVCCYSGLLLKAVNTLSKEVLGRELIPNVGNIGEHTGEGD